MQAVFKALMRRRLFFMRLSALIASAKSTCALNSNRGGVDPSIRLATGGLNRPTIHHKRAGTRYRNPVCISAVIYHIMGELNR